MKTSQWLSEEGISSRPTSHISKDGLRLSSWFESRGFESAHPVPASLRAPKLDHQDKWQYAPRRRDPTLHILLSTITRGQDYTGQWKAFTIRSLCDLSIRGSEDLLASNLDSALSSHNLDLVIEQSIKHTVLQPFVLELLVLDLAVLDIDQYSVSGSCKRWT